MKQEEYFHSNGLLHLKNILHKDSVKSIFLVTGKKSFSACGAEKILNEMLDSKNVFHFSDFMINPQLTDVEKGINLFKQNQCDVVVAVGGGSVIDMAKLINILAAQDGPIIDYIIGKNNIINKGKYLIAMPTTSGTGSESTHFAVVYINKMKYSVAHKNILPDVAIIYPQFTMNLSARITATSGMDALCQAIESYWCVNSTNESKQYAKESIRLIMENLSTSVNNPSKYSRENMAKAAHLAGKAINISKTTAPHAISYPLTSYFNIAHGHAVSLTIGDFLIYNYHVTEKDIVDGRGIVYVKKTIDEINILLCSNDVYESREMILKLMQEIGLETHLSDLNFKTEDDVRLILDNVNIERLKNNPRLVSNQCLKKILIGDIQMLSKERVAP